MAKLLEEICKEMVIEPSLLPVKTCPQVLTLVSDGARLDVSCINSWSPLSRAFIDVRIFNPQAQQSNLNKRIPAMYTSHQNGKKTKYGPGIRKVEKATLTAAVMSTPSFFISNNNFGEGFKLLNFGHF